MAPQFAGLLLLALGLVLAGLAAFAWPMLSKLPIYRLRSAIFGPQATRIISIVSGLIAAGAGVFLLVA